MESIRLSEVIANMAKGDRRRSDAGMAAFADLLGQQMTARPVRHTTSRPVSFEPASSPERTIRPVRPASGISVPERSDSDRHIQNVDRCGTSSPDRCVDGQVSTDEDNTEAGMVKVAGDDAIETELEESAPVSEEDVASEESSGNQAESIPAEAPVETESQIIPVETPVEGVVVVVEAKPLPLPVESDGGDQPLLEESMAQPASDPVLESSIPAAPQEEAPGIQIAAALAAASLEVVSDTLAADGSVATDLPAAEVVTPAAKDSFGKAIAREHAAAQAAINRDPLERPQLPDQAAAKQQEIQTRPSPEGQVKAKTTPTATVQGARPDSTAVDTRAAALQPTRLMSITPAAGLSDQFASGFSNGTAGSESDTLPGWALHLAQGNVGKRGDFVAQLRQHLQNLPTHEQVAVSIQRAVRDGQNRLSIQLSPAELGRIHVQLDIDEEKRVSAAVTVEKPSTLELLQRDTRQLERALQEAGLKLDSQGLSFSLGREEKGDFAQDFSRHQSRGGLVGDRQSDALTADGAAEAAALVDTANGLLDVQI